MAGYHNHSMSNNAIEAYYNGEMPLSKWKKSDILEAINQAIKESYIILNCSFDILSKTPVKVLKQLCLHKSSWHHTSSHYNKTDFYSLDNDAISELTDEIIREKTSLIMSASKDNQLEEINDTIYPNPNGCGDLHTVYHIVHKGYAEVRVCQVGDKQGNFWGVQKAKPEIYKIHKVG